MQQRKYGDPEIKRFVYQNRVFHQRRPEVERDKQRECEDRRDDAREEGSQRGP